MLIRLEEATQDALLEMTLREMHEALGEEQFRQFFGNLPEEVAETRRTYNEIRQQIWGETAQGIDSLKNPDAKGIIDPAELRTELESLGLENARRPNNEARDDLLERAVALEGRARAAGIPEFLILALLRRAAVLVAAGKDNEAIAPLEEARAKAALVAQSTYGVQALSMLADVASRREDWHDVMDIAQEGISLVEKYRYKVAAPYLQSAYMRARIKLYLLGIRAAYERAEIQLMIKWAELAKSRNALFYPQVETARSESIDQLREEFRKINEQIAAGRAQGTVQEELLHKRRTIWDLLFTARLQSTSRMSVPEFTLAALQDRLDEDEGILNYFWLDRLTLLIIGLDKRRIVPEVRRLTPDDRLLLEKLSRNITLQNQGSEEHPRTLNYGLLEKQVRAASSLLLPSCSEDLFKGKRKLIVSPHQLLHTVPFHAFQWHEGYLIESLAVSYVPNLSSLLLSYAPTENSQVLLVGVSDYNVPGLQLRPLAKATEEIETVRGIYESRGTAVKILKDQEATLDRLKSLVTEEVPGDFSCLHFSVHGESVSSNTPMESRLFLRDAQLDGLDIADWELRAPLVVLSACYSGQRSISGRGMEELPGDDLFGLQAAFFAGGVRQVIGGLWPVDSYAALPIMAHFHGSFASGVSPEVALQEAMKTYLKTADALTRMVYYWGPFFLVAMGRVDK
jgi:CHAT domain-containing protein